MSGRHITRTKVSIVESNPKELDLLCRNLHGLPGMDVVGTHSHAEEALQAMPQTKPQLVMTSVVLNGMDGLELTRRLKQQATRLKVLVVTRSHDRDTLGKALRSGADGYLTKPINREEMVQAVLRVLRGETHIGAPMMRGLVELARGDNGHHTPDSRLTERENELMELLQRGSTDREIGGVLGICETTVKKHLHNVYTKLGVRNRVEALNTLHHPV